MNLSKQSQELISQIGTTMANLYAMKLSPLQILILIEARYREGQLERGEHLYSDSLRKGVSSLYSGTEANFLPSKQGFWAAVKQLEKRKLLYIAPPKKDTSKRGVMLTASAALVFEYPHSIHPYRTKMPTPSGGKEELQ